MKYAGAFVQHLLETIGLVSEEKRNTTLLTALTRTPLFVLLQCR